MYSSAGTRWVGVLVLAFLCLALVEAQSGDSSSSVFSSSDGGGGSDLLPCKDNNERISMHGETYKMSECSECTCDNSTLSCKFISCQPVTCREPIKFVGECCKACPYNVTVNDVTPTLPGEQSLVEGEAVNDLAVNLDVLYANNRETTSVSGQGLWQTKLWLSSQEDGSTELPGTVVQNALTENQQSQDLKKAGMSSTHFRIDDIRYQVDMSDLSCDDAKYLCAKFNKGENPEVAKDFLEFYFEHRPDESVLTGCSPIENCKGGALVQVTGVTPTQKAGSIVKEGNPNQIQVDLGVSYVDSEQTTDISGEDLWTASMWLAGNQDGSRAVRGTRVEKVLSPGQRSQALVKDSTGLFGLNDVDYSFDLSGKSCSEAKYLCAKFNRNKDAKPAKEYTSFKMEAVPNDRVLTGCSPLENCKGVTIDSLSWSREAGQVQYGLPTPLTISAQVASTADSPQVEGSGLWKMNMFGSRSMNGSGMRLGERSQILDGFNQGKSLAGGGASLGFDGVRTNYPLEDLGCGEYGYLCLEFTKGDRPNPDYSFSTTSGEKSVISCLPEKCRSVYVSGLESTLTSADLYEGKANNLVQFNTIVQTTDESSPMVGRNMWRLNMYGSERPDGSGPRQAPQEQVLSDYYSSRELSTPGSTLNFQPVHTEFDMTGLNCDKLKYLCTEFSRNPESSEEFELNPVPDESVLRDCMEVEDDMCKGVIIDDMRWNMQVMSDEIASGKPTPIRFGIDVDPRSTAGSAAGDGLWRVGVFGATRPDGKGPRIGGQRQVLTRDQSGRDLNAGSMLSFPEVNTEFDLSSVGCESEYQYLCVEYAKGLRAEPDFKFQSSDGGDVVTRCKEQECRKGVKIEDLQVVGNDYSVLKENDAYNRVMFDLTGVTTEDSGGVDGDNLWELSLFGSGSERGVGRRLNEQKQVLSNYQQDKDVRPGEDVDFGMVDANFNMKGLSCNEVRFLCAELRRGQRARPRFELTPVPDPSVMTKCFRQKCDGIIVDSTDLRGDFKVDDQTEEIEFDVSVSSNSNSGDATGRNLWRLDTFLSNTPTGTQRGRTLDRQTLTPQMASRDLRSGSRMTFNNLAARINKEDVACDEGGSYVCVELNRGDAPSIDFTLSGARDGSLRKCRKIDCIKSPELIPGPKGSKGYPGEPASLPMEYMQGIQGPPGAAGPRGHPGRRGHPGMMGGPGIKGPSGDSGAYGYPGAAGRPGPPGPPGSAALAPTYTQQYNTKAVVRPPPQLLPGPPGPAGLPGKRGDQGSQGMRGVLGAIGPNGNLGPAGPPGRRGADGEDGRDGSRGMNGARGAAGAIGAQGGNGIPGAAGTPGHKGWRGARGRKGEMGDMGEFGDTGALGAKGPAGALGARGETGLAGARGERGGRGLAGARGKDGAVGEIGNQGPQGAAGVMGSMGLTGAKGHAGEQGDQGIQGVVGQPGESGSDGAPGATGSAGVNGKDGASGAFGDVGAAGAPGPGGAAGARGSSGARGATGVSGEPGAQGYPGLAGSRGSDGSRGTRGLAGNRGEAGSNGAEGSTGPDGPSGSAGARGPAGARGEMGGIGQPGVMGAAGLRGAAGSQGETGTPGERGDAGSQGRSGDAGAPGAAGAPGPEGRDGNDGKPGPAGEAGSEGARGAAGQMGLQGDRGMNGPAGAPGAAGEDGRTGTQGSTGLRGQRGQSGGSGPDGPVGPSGAQGARGDGGPQGAIGAPGPNGGMGAPGLRGAKGKRGSPGVAGTGGQGGAQGLSGDRGSPGAMGLSGAPGEAGVSGPDGRDGRDGEIGDMGAPGDVGQLGAPGLSGAPGGRGGVGAMGVSGAPGARGASGKRGESGKPGQRGNTGQPGPVGSPGLSGEAGDTGRSGPSGPEGPKGNQGERGRPGGRGVPGNRGQKGPAGAQGSRGVKGPQGIPGDAGQQGATGSPGQSGAPGVTGAKGVRGEAGEQGAVGPGGNSGNVGMPGSTGAVGPRGEVGRPGANGKPGPSGRRGESGAQGQRGIRGIPGVQGVSGSRGENGRPGSPGPAGAAGLAGTSGILGELGGMGAMGAPGPTGPAGRPGADGTTGRRGERGEDGATGRVGPQGAKGARGATGSDGRDGSDGVTGSQGLTGAAGDRGALGAQGPSGPAGMPGMRGPAGSQGERGSRGPAGPAGPRGSTGADGNLGPAGPVGPAGARGATGSTGVTGHKGWGGSVGAPGTRGPKGQAGGRGESGRPGAHGSPGIDGARGRNGKNGAQGPRGVSGTTGQRGSNGGSGPMGPPGPRGPAGAPGALSYSGYAYAASAGGGDKGQNPYAYYGDEAEVDEDDFDARIKQLRLRIMKLMVPNGEVEYPARSCKDLFKSYPHLPSGFYTLDPSAGSPYDKFVAYCDKKTNGTCIQPDNEHITKGTYYLGDHEDPVDFSDMKNGTEIVYGVKPVQLTLLRLIYSKASQNLTYHCRNSFAFHDRKGRTHRALTLVGPNGARMSPDSLKSDLKYDVEEDGCRSHDDTWRQTTVVYTTKKTERLPLVDFAVSDIGRRGQQFGVDVGPVCFS